MNAYRVLKIRRVGLRIFSILFLAAILATPGQPAIRAQSSSNSIILVDTRNNTVYGKNWEEGKYVFLRIHEPGTDASLDYTRTEQVVAEDPGKPYDTTVKFWFIPFELRGGMEFTMTDGSNPREYTLIDMRIFWVSAVHDYVMGEAEPGNYTITVKDEYGDITATRPAIFSENRKWIADFSSSDPAVDYIPYRSTAYYTENPVDGDFATIYRKAYTPRIIAHPSLNEVHGSWWEPESPITLTIDDPDINGSGIPDFTFIKDAQFNPESPYLSLVDFDHLPRGLVREGVTLTMTDGTTTNQHTVLKSDVTGLDMENDTISGITNPMVDVDVWVSIDDWNMLDQGERAEDGTWTIDFHSYDITSAMQVVVNLSSSADEPGYNMTRLIINQSYPRIRAALGSNRVVGRGWPQDKPVTLIIDDPATPDIPVDYTSDQPQFSEDSFGTRVDFLQTPTITPGMRITMRSRAVTKQFVAADIYDVTFAGNTVIGYAAPYSMLDIDAYDEAGNSASCQLYAYENGYWMVDFSSGEECDPRTLILGPGSWISIFQFDHDGDHTRLNLDFTFSEGSGAALIGPSGGTLTTPNEAYSIQVPAGALDEEVTLTITDEGSGYQLDTDLGDAQVALSADFGPPGTTFEQPVTITLKWADADNDGVVDGLDILEADLRVFKDGFSIAGPCSSLPSACNQAANTFTIQVNSLSQFVLGVVLAAPPSIVSLEAPLTPVLQGTTIIAQATLQDSGLNDTYQVVWDWGDGSPSTQQTVTGFALSAEHTYQQAGVYEINLSVSEEGLPPVAAVFRYVVVYDPEGGFVTGGGWYMSQAGWCQLDASCAGATGKANFGFVSKYQKGASVPSGNTEFQFKAGGLNFHSDSYQWLVVNKSDQVAQYKGAGTINGGLAPNGQLYKFMIWAADGSSDTFRIKIWYELDGSEILVYDNSTEVAIGGGNITVHQP